MKLIAYISIFLIVHSNVIFAGERAARVLLAPQEKKGKPVTYQIDEFKIPEPIQVSNGETHPKTKHEEPLNTALIPNSNSSSQAISKVPTGLAKQLQNLSSALPISAPTGTQPKDEDLGRKLPGSPNGENSSGGGSEGQSFGRWYPVCVLIDPSIGDANKQITELVQMSAACQVNLVPFVRVVTIANPDDEKSINDAQRSTCNLKEAGVAEKGSTLVITNRSSTVADKMCGILDKDGKPKTEVAGCNELGSGASAESKQMAEGKKTSGDGFGGVATGSVAVGIVDAQGYQDGKTWSHEAIGHGEMGWPNGKDAGNGIGDPNNKNENSSGEGAPGSYTPGKGCPQMQASAIPDPQHYRKFYANKTSYYSHEAMSKNPMQLGEPIWKKFKDGPQTSDVAQKNPTAPPRGNDQNSSPSGSPSTLATAGPGHKKPMGQGSTGYRSGDTNAESGRVAKRGGDDSPDTAGSPIDGKGGGPALGNNMIVADPNAKNSDGENPSADSSKSGFGNQSSDFFAGSSKSESNSTETQTASIMKNKKTGDDGLNDTDFFKKSLGEKIDTRIGRTKPRTSDGTFAGTSGNGTSINRTPSSSPSTPQRKQVGFEGGV